MLDPSRFVAYLNPVGVHFTLNQNSSGFGGEREKSFVTALAGLVVRLETGKGGNVEAGFPDSVPMQIRGEKMVAKIYAFKEGKAETYTTNEGVIFAINGQTHGALPKSIFSRKSVKLGRLSDSLLLYVDCTGLSINAREDLFMNSRDRLSQHQLRKEIEAELEDILAKHPRLKELANLRKANEINERLANTKPLEEVLECIIKSSPNLNALFRTGQRLSNPLKKQEGGAAGGGGGTGRGGGLGGGPGDKPFVGKAHPTYFRFYRKKNGEFLIRNCEHGKRTRLAFETDVENAYFKRVENPGFFEIEVLDWQGKDAGDPKKLDIHHSLILHDGYAGWGILLPDEVEIGHSVTLQFRVFDAVYPDGWTNVATLTVAAPSPKQPKPSPLPPKPPGTGGGGERPTGIELPQMYKVKGPEWKQHSFDQNSACKIVQENDGSYAFYINVDNIHLKHEIKSSIEDAALFEAKFMYANVLVGLALIQDEKNRKKTDDKDEDGKISIEHLVYNTTRALGPFLVPMINYLGQLTDEEIAVFGHAGDED